MSQTGAVLTKTKNLVPLKDLAGINKWLAIAASHHHPIGMNDLMPVGRTGNRFVEVCFGLLSYFVNRPFEVTAQGCLRRLCFGSVPQDPGRQLGIEYVINDKGPNDTMIPFNCDDKWMMGVCAQAHEAATIEAYVEASPRTAIRPQFTSYTVKDVCARATRFVSQALYMFRGQSRELRATICKRELGQLGQKP